MSIIIPANTLAAGGFDVDNSVRFNAPDDAYMHKTPSSNGSRRIGTFSIWVKLALNTSEGQYLFSGSPDASTTTALLLSIDGDALRFNGWTGNSQHMLLVTDRKFRDASAWYHIVVAWDTTQGTASNRVKIYINGVQETSFSTETYPDQNRDLNINNASNKTLIGARSDANYAFGDGYYSEVVMIDGTALAPTDFGEFDEDSNIWKPIKVSGLTFGTNGFYLDFKASGNLGNDANGGTDLTEVNLEATDQTTDTCTNNFMTLNRLIGTGTYTDNQVYSEGNTIVIPNSTDNYGTAFGTFGATRGKWYWEAQIIWNGTSNNANYPKQIGFMRENYAFNKSYLGQNDDQTWGVAFHDLSTDGWGLDHNGSFGAITGATTLADDKMLMFALDLDNGKFYMGYDGTFFTSGDPTSGATGTGAIATLDATDLSFTIIPALTNATDSTHYKMNFGNPAYAIASSNADGDGFGNFEFAVPSNYFSWCTKNLAEYG